MKLLYKKLTNLIASAIFVIVPSFISTNSYASQLIATKQDLSEHAVNQRGAHCTEEDKVCYFMDPQGVDCDIIFKNTVIWELAQDLVIQTKGSIIFEKEARLIVERDIDLFIKSGINPGNLKTYNAAVKFNGYGVQIESLGKGNIKIYANPTTVDKQHKYLNPNYNHYRSHIKANTGSESKILVYMLVNDLFDLQNIRLFLSGNYALSQDINGEITSSGINWNGSGNGRFIPISYGNESDNSLIPFSGKFDGNSYTIKNLYIDGAVSEESGLFGRCQGGWLHRSTIENLTLDNCKVLGTGANYGGILAGVILNTEILNVNIINSNVEIGKTRGLIAGLTHDIAVDGLNISLSGFDLDTTLPTSSVSGLQKEGSIFDSYSIFREKTSTKDSSAVSFTISHDNLIVSVVDENLWKREDLLSWIKSIHFF